MTRPAEGVLFSNTQRFGPVLRMLRASGLDTGELLAEHDLTEAELLDPRTRLPRERILRAVQTVAAKVSDPETLGVRAAEYFQLSDLGLLGYIIRHSEHVLGGLQRFARYSRLMADAAECRVQIKDRRVTFRLGLAGARPITPQGVDYVVATTLVGARELTDPPIAALAVRLARPRPRNPKPFHALFGVRVQFDAPHSELVFEHRASLVPGKAYDPQLLAILEHSAHSALAGLPELDSLIEQVRTLIADGLPSGAHGADHIAARLGLSTRTLRRRLEQAGLSHRTLLDQVRRERAETLVADGQLSVVEVAQSVGFSDPSAFASAYRRWTGRSPRSARSTRTRR